jgi:hypothetical protein
MAPARSRSVSPVRTRSPQRIGIRKQSSRRKQSFTQEEFDAGFSPEQHVVIRAIVEEMVEGRVISHEFSVRVAVIAASILETIQWGIRATVSYYTLRLCIWAVYRWRALGRWCRYPDQC